MLEQSGPFESAAASHVGRVRAHNEDSFLSRPDIGLWTVADGMGGHEAGEVASAAVVDHLRNLPRPFSAAGFLEAVQQRLEAANTEIRALAEARGNGIIGTTVISVLAFQHHFACVWSGDSRAYLVRGAGIRRVSRDHTEVEELLANGVLTPDEARTWPRRNVITRAIGVFDTVMADMEYGTLNAGDTFVLCSDGLTAHVSDEEILDIVRRLSTETACRELIELTLERGAQDNVTVIVVRYRPQQPGGFARPEPTRRPWE